MGIAAYLRALAQLGPRHVVVTDGARGAFVGCAEGILYAPALASPVVGTAGAGDAFSATFSAYVAHGRPAETALRAAAINSAAVVARIDTQSGLLCGAELAQRLAANPQQPRVRRWTAADPPSGLRRAGGHSLPRAWSASYLGAGPRRCGLG
jgi:ribokinase